MTTVDGAELLDIATAAAEATGKLLLRSEPGTVTTKSAPADLVTDLDRVGEALIVEMITTVRPHDSVLGEEHGARPGTSGVRWVVDPLDGTGNYVRGLPSFAVSVAAEVDDRVVAGVVHDPSRQETFRAVRGRGATCNGRKLAASDTLDLARAVVSTGFSSDSAHRRRQAALLETVLEQVADVRSSGSAALDLCWVACGRLDGYYESDTRYWDRAAGVLIAEEAGAVVRGGDEMVFAAAPGLGRALHGLVVAGESAVSSRKFG
ncbi:inositol monophosphatase family protein [Saccharomonospora sp. NB11]|uniref:inositol monophosphatase family protein n=1 Tax=Saccharomonospora sp. NB11 TaxID=1642298 RepID=UPI0018D0E468|nr:inositol monophosphatase family protein [Saccharomonospora sp. NB11]